MNLLISLAVTALVGGSALFMSTVAPEPIEVESDMQAHTSTEVSASTPGDANTPVEENDEISFGSQIKNFLHLDASDDGERSTKVKTQTDIDASVEVDTDVETNAEGSGLIEVNL